MRKQLFLILPKNKRSLKKSKKTKFLHCICKLLVKVIKNASQAGKKADIFPVSSLVLSIIIAFTFLEFYFCCMYRQ